MADVLGTTIVYKVMRDSESRAQDDLKVTELTNKLKNNSALPEDYKTLVLKMIKDYIRDFNTQ